MTSLFCKKEKIELSNRTQFRSSSDANHDTRQRFTEFTTIFRSPEINRPYLGGDLEGDSVLQTLASLRWIDYNQEPINAANSHITRSFFFNSAGGLLRKVDAEVLKFNGNLQQYFICLFNAVI